MADLMPRPGKTYVVQPGDTLTSLAVRAYGDSKKYAKIYNANAETIHTGDPNLIHPGDILIIPIDEEKALVIATAKAASFSRDPHAFTVFIDGMEVPVKNARLGISFDSGIDEGTGTIAWTPGADKELDRRVSLKTGMYCPVQIYLGSKLMLTGRTYEIMNHKSNEGTIKTFRWNSLTADIVDSTLKSSGSLEYRTKTLRQLAEEVLNPLGYAVSFDGSSGADFNFYVSCVRGEKVFTFLARMAAQRAFLIANDEFGNVVIHRANSKQAPIGTLTEGKPPVTEWGITVNGRERFRIYDVVGISGDLDDIQSESIDKSVPVSRRVAFTYGDVDLASVKNVADWRRSKALSKALTFNLPVSTWYGPDGKLWTPGTIVRVESPSMELSKGFNFLIVSVAFEKGDNTATATISLTPPQALTGEEIPEVWS